MDSSRRAVESYWRSRMIDAATSDEDKVTPVYKLEEICDLLRSSHVSIVKEISDVILKRLDHKSPIVKQKALRLIKYAVGKSGAEFRREMQRHSVAMRQLFHYKGQPDPLKGDALNKAVRDTAHEALSSIFSEETKSVPTEHINRRIQGFGNTNFEMPLEDKKSFLSEVVGIGSASIKQSISTLTQGHSFKKNDDGGNYKSPALRRSLTLEPDNQEIYEPVRLPNDSHGSTVNMSGHWAQDSQIMKMDAVNGESSSRHSGIKTREERLLETVVTSGGIRLQPTRDAVQTFLVEAAKLDALALSHAIESKLESPIWQVRMRAVCVLESILRKNNDGHFSVVASYFLENNDAVLRCADSPQSSLREKANKVLSLLDVEVGGSPVSVSGKSINNEATVDLTIPNLIDTVDLETENGAEHVSDKQGDQSGSILTSQNTDVTDLFGRNSVSGLNADEQKTNEDPFIGVSFHSNEGDGITDDLFTGMSVAAKSAINGNHVMLSESGPEFVDIFGLNTEPPSRHEHSKKDINDLMDELSLNGKPSEIKTGITSESASGGVLLSTNHALNQQSTTDGLSGMPGIQVAGLETNHALNQQSTTDGLSGMPGIQGAGLETDQMLPFGAVPYNISHGMMLNPAFFSQPMNYGAMGGLFTQQQLFAAMSNLQQFGNLNSQNTGVNNISGVKEVYGSPLPDIFQSKYPGQPPSSLVSSSQKEDSRAFDFISDHLSAARGSKGGR